MVWDDTGKGVKAYLGATAEFANGRGSGHRSFATDERGYFQLGFAPDAILVDDEGLGFFSQQIVPRRVTGGGSAPTSGATHSM